jgi:hypothetical protein
MKQSNDFETLLRFLRIQFFPVKTQLIIFILVGSV